MIAIIIKQKHLRIATELPNRPRRSIDTKVSASKPESNQRERGGTNLDLGPRSTPHGRPRPKMDLLPSEETRRRGRGLRAGWASRREGRGCRRQGSSGRRGAWIDATPAAQRAELVPAGRRGLRKEFVRSGAERARERDERTDFYFNIYFFPLARHAARVYFIVVR